MGRRKIRVVIENPNGDKSDIKFEGDITKEKILEIFNMVGLMDVEQPAAAGDPVSVGGKIWNIIDKHYPMDKFTSTNLLEKYEDEYAEPIKLATISTYLARFNERGRVNRLKSGKGWTYQTIKPNQTHLN